MARHVPDDQLRPADVPPADAPWPEVSAFGHTFHAYKVAGSLQRVSELTVATHDAWAADGTLPDDLARLRLALFHTVRATGDAEPDDDTARWARELVGAIRARVVQRGTSHVRPGSGVPDPH